MAADASTAAMCTYLIEARKYGAPTPDLPVSRDGKPKPAPPWIAAALYIVASNPTLHPLTGVSVTPAQIGPPGLDPGDSLPVHDRCKAAHCGFDFGEFRHGQLYRRLMAARHCFALWSPPSSKSAALSLGRSPRIARGPARCQTPFLSASRK